ncbi:hypothetical protein D3C73_873610 [compost metagenome]
MVIAHQGVGDRPRATGDRADQSAGGGFAGVARIAAGYRAGGQVLAVLAQVQRLFVDGDFIIDRSREATVDHIDGDGRGALVTIGITDGVGEGVTCTGAVHRVRVAVVFGIALGIKDQVAVGAIDLGTDAAVGRSRGVRTETHANHATTRSVAIGAADVVVQHVAGDDPAFAH